MIFWLLLHPTVHIWKAGRVRWCITKWDVFSNFPLPAIQHGWAEPGLITGISVVVSRKYQLVCESTRCCKTWIHPTTMWWVLSEMIFQFTDLKTFNSHRCSTVSACEYPMSRLWSATLIISALSSLCTTEPSYFIQNSCIWTRRAASMLFYKLILKLFNVAWAVCRWARQELDL